MKKRSNKYNWAGVVCLESEFEKVLGTVQLLTWTTKTYVLGTVVEVTFRRQSAQKEEKEEQYSGK